MIAQKGGRRKAEGIRQKCVQEHTRLACKSSEPEALEPGTTAKLLLSRFHENKRAFIRLDRSLALPAHSESLRQRGTKLT